MENEEIVEEFKAKDGFIVAEIVMAENRKYQLWRRQKSDSGKGNRQSNVGEYDELSDAKAEAKVIVEKYEQDQIG